MAKLVAAADLSPANLGCESSSLSTRTIGISMLVNFPHQHDLPICVSGLILTRSEVTGLMYFDTLLAAVKHAWEDKTVWKISYQTENGWQRFVIR
jgi:hypothetical protein